MHKLTCLGLLAIVAAVPLTFAHSPAGTPKNYCEPVTEWNMHDFTVGRRNFLVFYGYDGNVVGDCNLDTVPGDFDGHQEWAYGGGWLLASDNLQTPESDGATVCFGAAPHHLIGATVNVADTTGAAIAFQIGIDWPMGGGDPDPSTPYACGDGIIDPCDPLDFSEVDDVTCEANDRLLPGFGSLSLAGFLPGQDGSYIVFVEGTAGHFWT